MYSGNLMVFLNFRRGDLMKIKNLNAHDNNENAQVVCR